MKLILSIYLAVIPFILIAQNEAIQSDVSTKGGLVYKNNVPFTGVLYSDETASNNCKCTLEAYYTNGKLNGKKREWYRNGKLKSEAVYKNGQLSGDIKNFDKNGDIVYKN